VAISEFMSANVESRARDSTVSALTVEVAMYVALFFFAFAIRFFVLDLAPLNSDEARQALAAWKFVRGDPGSYTGSPLLFSLHSLFFIVFGASDFTARAMPAFSGAALILLPAFIRRDLGRTGAVIASLLLAFSPSLVFLSRSVDGIMAAATCSLAAIIFGKRYLESRAAGDMYFAAAFAALGLLSAADAWTIALSLGLWFAASRLGLVTRRDIQGSKNEESVPTQTNNNALSVLIFFFLVFVGTATTFLLHREGLGAAFDQFGTWVDSFRLGFSVPEVLRLLIVYEPLILLFGVAGLLDLIFSLRETPSIAAEIIGFWCATAFLLLSFSANDSPARIAVIVVPLALLAGVNVGTWIERATNSMCSVGTRDLVTHEMPILAVAIGLTSFLAILLAELAQRGSIFSADTFGILGSSPDNINLSGTIVATLSLITLFATSVLAITTLGTARARNVGILFVLVLGSLWTIRQMSMLNFPAGRALNPQEWIVARAAAPNVRDLVNDLEDASRWRANDTHTIVSLVDSSLGPILEWNLRVLTNVRFLQHPTASSDTQALVLPGNALPPAVGWISQKYEIEVTRGAAGGGLRALIYRDSGGLDVTSASLWIPTPP
jgi:uncharacterized protein (TIGR03663 family)